MILKKIITKIIKNKNKLSFKNNFYKKLKKQAFISLSRSHLKSFKKKKINIYLLGDLIFPFQSFGKKVSTLNLFSLDEIIIFCYYISSRKKYQNVADMGANIGLHSIMLGKFFKNVDSYEPDNMHTANIKKNLKLNKIKNVKIIKKAVSNKSTNVDFIRVLNNSTSSHIAGLKPNAYGRLKTIKIKSIEFRKIIRKYDFIKMDVEGHEADIILNTKKTDWENTDLIVEVGSNDNAKKIFNHLYKNLKIPMFSQKNNWLEVKTLKHMPINYKEGSLFISKKNKFNFMNIMQ